MDCTFTVGRHFPILRCIPIAEVGKLIMPLWSSTRQRIAAEQVQLYSRALALTKKVAV